MKQISPIQMWLNGVFVEGTILNAWASNLVLNTNATFSYDILNDAQERLQSGTLLMTGEAYTKWTQDNYAWDWIASELKLTIIGDYVPSVVEEIITK